LKEGFLNREDMMGFIPLNLTAFQRSETLNDWIQSWLGNQAEFLLPDDWFERGHNIASGSNDSKGFWQAKICPGIVVWSPPPVAAAMALEELRRARIKRQDLLHVVVIPRLLKPEWFRQLYKT
jgi:hypothetical protein